MGWILKVDLRMGKARPFGQGRESMISAASLSNPSCCLFPSHTAVEDSLALRGDGAGEMRCSGKEELGKAHSMCGVLPTEIRIQLSVWKTSLLAVSGLKSSWFYGTVASWS